MNNILGAYLFDLFWPYLEHSSEGGGIEAGDIELLRKGLNFFTEVDHTLVTHDMLTEVGEFRARLLLNVSAQLAALVEEAAHLQHIVGVIASRGHCWCSNSDATRCDCGLVTLNSVLVNSDVHLITHLLEFGAREALVSDAHDQQVVVGATCDQIVAAGNQVIC